MQERVETIVRERLRDDAPTAWAMAGDGWRTQLLHDFYPSQNAFRAGLVALASDLRRAELPIDLEGMADLHRASVESVTVGELIQRILALLAAPEEDTRIHRGSHEAAVGDQPFIPVQVYYATDRDPVIEPGHLVRDFGPERDPEGVLRYGICDVTVPASHRMGKLESPNWWRFEFRPDPAKHITLRGLASMGEDTFFESVADTVSKAPRQDAFVFVHGFNVSFQDAARRAAQMAFDLEFQGAPIIYSWPSRAEVFDYTVDEASAIWTVPHLEHFLETLAARSGAARIHVIAHSMGNRAVCDALERLSRSAWAGKGALHHLVLTAPDIDAGTFKDLAARVQTTADTVTVYASSNDKAIRLSERIHSYPRAGTPLVFVPGVETVDASAVDTDFLGHSFFSTARTVLSDIFWLLRDDKRAGERFGLQAMKRAGEIYYVIRK
ncbi:alpha/beta hydrolase [Rhizobium ruizarguesonis]